MKEKITFILAIIFGVFPLASPATASEIKFGQFKNADHVLSFEVLSDRLIHFDYSSLARAPAIGTRLSTTPSISQIDFTGTAFFTLTQTTLETASALIEVDPQTLCFTLFDKIQNEMLTRACPNVGSNGNALSLDQLKIQNLYGLGEQFRDPGVANGDWMGKIRSPGNQYGNAMTAYGGGHTGNAQFPILYALGPDHLNYAFYLDTVYPYQWDFTKSPWQITQTKKGSDLSFRGYFFLGANLPELRSTFMDLVGHPSVPPKKAFGLWVSEYGYRNWEEIENHVTSLRANHFPVDGFVLDLFWFGPVSQSSTTSPMGSLSWDLSNFPNPKKQIADFKNNDGIGLMTIEESYVSSDIKTYEPMATRGFFVGNNQTNAPMVFDTWWGKGSGIDWTQSLAGSAWHNELRKPQLTDNGVTFHWTDLGEPEASDDRDTYLNPNGIGTTEADSHNLYNFYWDKSIDDGYQSNHETQRHFIMSRSGTTGIQRFGAGMWSGDIGSNLRSLAGHFNVQMNMSLSGIDYFGADTGGFNRLAVEGDINDVYTRWLANSSLFDIPVRPHADDGSKINYTAPDRIGDVAANLENLRTRYELAPYYYSLAYRAHEFGEALIPPLVYYFQEDQNVRQIADEKMIGPSLLAATSAALGEESRNVYLPAGDWVDYRNLTWFHSAGQTYPKLSLRNNGHFELPIFVRAGAIIPKAQVDNQTMNILGKLADGSVISDLIVQVFAATIPTKFNLIEDDGETESYKDGAFAKTTITQTLSDHSASVVIAATEGTYSGAPDLAGLTRSRCNVILGPILKESENHGKETSYS
jgi:alpha-glucosidase (family GH31 glycosyl hydrolase)